MENQDEKPRDFFRYPTSKIDLIRFDIPDQEKELKQKLTNIKELLTDHLKSLNLSVEKIYDTTLRECDPNDREIAKVIISQQKWDYGGRSFYLSNFLNLFLQITLKFVEAKLQELLPEDNGGTE